MLYTRFKQLNIMKGFIVFLTLIIMAVGAKDWTLYEQWNCKYITGVIQSGCDRPSPVVYQADVCIGERKIYQVAGDTITLSRYEDDDCTRLRPGQQFKYKMMNMHLEAGLRYIKVLPLKSFEVLKQIAVQKIQCMEAAK